MSSYAIVALEGGCSLGIAQARLAASIGVATACGPSAAARALGRSKIVTSLRAESEAPG